MIKKITAGSGYIHNPHCGNLYAKKKNSEKKSVKADSVTISREAMELYEKSVRK